MTMIIYIFLSHATCPHASNQTRSRNSLARANEQPNIILLHVLGLATASQASPMRVRLSSYANQTDP
jgi:hypothetical protein